MRTTGLWLETSGPREGWGCTYQADHFTASINHRVCPWVIIILSCNSVYRCTVHCKIKSSNKAKLQWMMWPLSCLPRCSASTSLTTSTWTKKNKMEFLQLTNHKLCHIMSPYHRRGKLLKVRGATLLNWSDFLLQKSQSYGEALNLRGAMAPLAPLFRRLCTIW